MQSSFFVEVQRWPPGLAVAVYDATRDAPDEVGSCHVTLTPPGTANASTALGGDGAAGPTPIWTLAVVAGGSAPGNGTKFSCQAGTFAPGLGLAVNVPTPTSEAPVMKLTSLVPSAPGVKSLETANPSRRISPDTLTVTVFVDD